MALFPPIVASSMPAFNVNDGKVRIYFTLSNYNTIKIDEIKAVHITVRNQSSNVNVVNNVTEIIDKPFSSIDRTELDKSLNRYFVDINNSQINDGFKVDTLYKVQLRFSSVLNSGANFYTNNTDKFSEWSTVCIIKPITAPEFYIQDFYNNGERPKETDTNYFFYTLADFVGVYKQKESSEKLKYWRLRLLKADYTSLNENDIDQYTLSDSGIILAEAENYNIEDDSIVLSCSLPYQLKDKTNYKLLFEIQTKNGYQDSLLYPFTCNQQYVNTLTGSLTTYINEEEGYIKLNFKSSEIEKMNLLIRRTDSKSNFLKWEDLKYIEVYDDANFTYYDFTAQSGLFYRYLVQRVDARGRRGTPVYDQTHGNGSGTMAEWEHAFLLQDTGNGDVTKVKQLKLKYDFQISSYKTNVSESKTDTLGSQYPFIRRNGSMYYRSFPISGTITQFMDEAHLLTNSDTLFDGKFTKYQEFKGQIGNYTTQYDYTYERKFREKVEQFLYNAKPKLYKSMQQGNIFIKLMQVSLTPKNELGRLVYSFSATAYEIDEACIKTYNSYNLLNVGNFNPNLTKTKTTLAQISSFGINNDIMDNPFKAGKDIIGTDLNTAAANSIAKYIKYNEPFNNKIVTTFTINWLRLTIESDPYLIIENSDGTFRPFDDVIPEYAAKNPNYIDKDIVRNNNIESIERNNYQDDITSREKSGSVDYTTYPLYQFESSYKYNNITNNVYLGWLFTLKRNASDNGVQIIVAPPNNIYEIKEDTFQLNMNAQLIPAKDTAMLVDFRLIEVKAEDLSTLPKNIRINTVNGQLIGKYSENTELISDIYYKYRYEYTDVDTKERIVRFVNGVKTILIDTEPNTIVMIRTSKMDDENRFIVNANGQLNFDPMNNQINIVSFRIIGFNALYSQIRDRGTVNNFNQITAPLEGDICHKNNTIYYYHNGSWYFTTEYTTSSGSTSLDIHCPIDALIFYSTSVEERIF